MAIPPLLANRRLGGTSSPTVGCRRPPQSGAARPRRVRPARRESVADGADDVRVGPGDGDEGAAVHEPFPGRGLGHVASTAEPTTTVRHARSMVPG